MSRKRREGLNPRTMRASDRLSSALINAEMGTVRMHVFNGNLTWGLRSGTEVMRYAQVQAARGRRAVTIDRAARKNIAQRIETFLANGFVR